MFTIYQMELFQVFNTFHPCFFNLCQIICIIQSFQDLFVASFGSSIFLVEVIEDITYTNTVTAHLISISRADTFSGSTYFSIPLSGFISSIENTVCRQNEMRFL